MSYRVRRRFVPLLTAHRGWLVCADAATWIAALLVATWLRYEFAFQTSSVPKLLVLLAAVALTHVGVGLLLGLYASWWRPGSFEEAYVITLSVMSAALFGAVANLALSRPIPEGAVLVAGPMAFLGIAGLRWGARLRIQRRLVAGKTEQSTRTIIFGAGEGGIDLIASMRRDPERTYEPVALLDDDPAKSRLRAEGLLVRGGREALADVVAASDAELVVIAIPSAGADLIRDLSDRCRSLGIDIRVLPTVAELLDGNVSVADVRPVSYVDLLGRREVDIDVDAISHYLTGKRLLVTGAGGSIGSELCRQLKRFAPETLVMLDRDESALHALQLSMDGRALLDDRTLVVADIRDRQRMVAVFAEHRPQVVFHAAALKHLPLLEMHPQEAVKSNVWGTWNILGVSAAARVERFVNISTDKAADPVSVLGYSKRIAERLTSWFDVGASGAFVSVRFGNVLGSRGSVLSTFQSQVAAGQDITVTDPDVSRYFMTVEEAVRLVIQAGAVGVGGEVLVLDMGEPVRIADVARRLIEEAGSRSEIIYTGLRPGEKLHEALLAEGEVDARPSHPFISQVTVPPLSPADVKELPVGSDVSEVVEGLRCASTGAARLPEPRLPVQVNESRPNMTVDLSSRLRRVNDPHLTS
jgi:FlaA1/EpsC-like NDP-sugar epimerase